MRFGAAKECITPTKPMRLACTGDFTQPFTAIHDDVFVRALVLEEGETRVALMAFDLLFHDRSLTQALEAYAGEAYGIRPGGLLVTYTHAHTTPASRGYNPGAEDEAYEAFLLDRAKCCLDRALCALAPGYLEWGGFEADFNISRRGTIDGAFANAPNFSYDHDTRFSLLCVRDEEGQLRSVVMNYACHPVFYPGLRTLSGEFPARLCQYVDAAHYGCVSLFCQSAGGDVRPAPTAHLTEEGVWRFRPMDFAAIEAFSTKIGETVTRLIREESCEKLEGLSLAHSAFVLPLPMEPAPLSYFRQMERDLQDGPETPDKNNARFIANGGYDTLSDTLPLHCQIFRLTPDHYIAAMGGEPCYGVKQAVCAAFGGRKVLFVGYTDACAYLVDDRMLAEGGYEPTCHTEYRLIGPLKAGVTKRYTDGFAEALAELEGKS